MACGNIRKTATLLVNSVVIRNRAEHRRKESNRALLGRLDCNGGKKIRAYERFALRLSPRSIIIVNFQTDQPYSPATLSRPVVHLRNSEPVLGRTISAELGHNLSHEHHKYSAGALCTQRGTYLDAYGSLSAHRRCNRALLSRPVVHLWNS